MVKFKGKYTIVYSLRDVFSRKLLIADKIFLLEEEDIILKY